MQEKDHGRMPKGSPAEALARNRQAISQLAQSGEAQKLMTMLQKQGGVKEAAQAAAAGDAAQLIRMMDRLMKTKEGADLVDQISSQAKKVGLE